MCQSNALSVRMTLQSPNSDILWRENAFFREYIPRLKRSKLGVYTLEGVTVLSKHIGKE